MRRLVGVVGATDDGATVDGRDGDAGRRGDGGVTSVCRMEVKIAFACSVRRQQARRRSQRSTDP